MAIESQWMQNRTYSAREDRAVIAALFDEGVIDLTMFEVTPDSPTAMTVEVTAGTAIVVGDDQTNQNSYCVQSTAVETSATITAPTTNPRIDLIVLQGRDPDATGPAGDDFIIDVVTGSEAASPVAPAVPATALVLAEISLSVAQVSIESGDITDRRKIAGRRDAPGVMQLYTGTSSQVPTGWLLCNGQAVNRSDYPALNALYSAQSYPFGNGNGTTTFNVPDVRDRVVAASGTTKTTVGATGGATTVTLSTAQLPSHTHGMNSHNHSFSATSSTHSGHTHSDTFSTASNGAHEHSTRSKGTSQYGYIAQPTVQAATGGSGSGFNRWNVTVYSSYASSGNDDLVTDNAGAHTHTINGSVSSGGSHSHTVSGTTGNATGNTASTGSGSSVAIEQPYIVINGWIVRT